MKNLHTLLFAATTALAIVAAVTVVQTQAGNEPTIDIARAATSFLSGD